MLISAFIQMTKIENSGQSSEVESIILGLRLKMNTWKELAYMASYSTMESAQWFRR